MQILPRETWCGFHCLLFIVAVSESHSHSSEPPCAGNYEQDWDERRQLLRDWLKFGIFLKFYGKNKFVLKWILELLVFMANLSNIAPSSIFLQIMSSGRLRPGQKVCKPNSKGGVEFRWHVLVANSGTFRQYLCFQENLR